MCDKHSFQSAPPLDPEENYKRRTQKTMWLTGTRCVVCNGKEYTDGERVWCGQKCTKVSNGLMFQEDHFK